MLKILLNYLKYSGVWAGFVVNPYHWEFRFVAITPTEMDPDQRGFFISAGPFWVRGILDNGSW
jgi:hypothetical protein